MQVEAESNMKSQVTGVRKSNEEADQGYVKHKRIKLVHAPVENVADQESQMGASTDLDASNNFKNEINGSSIPLNAEEDMQINSQENGISQTFSNGSINNGNESLPAEYSNNGIDDEQDTIIDVGDHYQSEAQPVSPDDCVTDVKEAEMNNEVPHEVNMHSDVTKSFENDENEQLENLKDSPSVSCTSSSKDLSDSTQKNSDASEAFVTMPATNSNDSFVVQKNIPNISQEGLSSVSKENVCNSSGSVSSPSEVLCIPEKDSRKEMSESPWKAFVEQLNSSKDDTEPIQKSFTPFGQTDVVESEQSPAETIDITKKEDIKYLGIYELKTTQLNGHADVIFCVAADGDLVISSSGDTTVKIWNVEEEKEICNLAGHSDAVTAVILLTSEQARALASKLSFPDNSAFVITASLDCHIKLWSVADGKEILSVYTYNSITCMDYLHSEFSVVIGTDGGKLEVWDLIAAKKIESVLAHESSVSSLKVNDSYVYSTSSDGAVKVWLFDDNEELQPLYSRRRRETSTTGTDLGPTHWKAIAFCNDMLFLGDTTPYLKALNWRVGRLTLFTNQLERAGVCDAIFVKDNILLTTFYNATRDIAGINVWSLPDITYVGTLTGDVQDIYCLSVTQNADKLRIVSGGHQLIVWDFNLKEPSKKGSSDSLYVCEIDGLGTEINEKFYRSPSTSKSNIISHTEKEVVKEKQGSCNII